LVGYFEDGVGSPNVLLGVPSLRELGVLCGVSDVLFRHGIITRAAKWLNGAVLIDRYCKERKMVVTTYMSGTVQHVDERVSKMPIPFCILGELDGEEGWPLGPRPGVPMSLVGIVVYESGGTTFLPLVVVLGNFGQISIFVDVVGKDKYASLVCIAKAGRRCGWEFAEQHRGIRSHVESLGGEMDRKGVETRCLAVVIRDNMSDGAIIKPKGLSTLSKGYLSWLNGRLE
jgi:hypothetical protein